MFEKIIDNVYNCIHEYVDIQHLLYVCTSVQDILNEKGYVSKICYNESCDNMDVFTERCRKHAYMLTSIKLMNVSRPFSSIIQLANIRKCELHNCYITNQLSGINKNVIIELTCVSMSYSFVKDYPFIETLSLCHTPFDYMAKLSHIKELYLYTKNRLNIPCISLPMLRTIMVNGMVKKITSPKLKVVVCSVICNTTFIQLHVDTLDIFINGFGIYYKKIGFDMLDKLSIWKQYANKYINEMCEYIYMNNYRHTFETGITATEFMTNVIHKYQYRDNTIIYRGVKKISTIPKNNMYYWGFEEIVFNP